MARIADSGVPSPALVVPPFGAHGFEHGFDDPLEDGPAEQRIAVNHPDRANDLMDPHVRHGSLSSPSPRRPLPTPQRWLPRRTAPA